MEFHIVIPVLISFAISAVLGPVIIPFLRKLKMGQTERTEGVQSHLKKAGTPTMGGVIFLISTIITSLFYVKDYPKIIPVLFLTLGFGLIGFLDDYLKVVLRRSDGLLPKQKMLGQIIVTTIFLAYILIVDKSFLTMRIPFSDQYFDCKWITVPLVYLAVIGTVNGTNFTDGLDGLASSVTVLVATFFTVNEICHIVSKDLHNLHSFEILFYFIRIRPMYHIPISRCDNRHLHQTKIFIYLIPCGRCSGPSC